jgi:bacterioferritin-associated ferredoxin
MAPLSAGYRSGSVYVCLCYAVTETRIRDAITAGARDVADLGRRTGAGADCGQCRERLSHLIADLVARATESTDPGTRRT